MLICLRSAVDCPPGDLPRGRLRRADVRSSRTTISVAALTEDLQVIIPSVTGYRLFNVTYFTFQILVNIFHPSNEGWHNFHA